MHQPWHYYLMAITYLITGLMHFLKPKMYERIMPHYLPGHKLLVIISGITEITLGLLLFSEKLHSISLYAIILMLTFFLPVHIHMLANEKASLGLPRWLLVARIPLQFVLIYWAYHYL